MLSAQKTISIVATTRRVAMDPGKAYASNEGIAAAGRPIANAQSQVWCHGAKAKDSTARHHRTPTIRRSARTWVEWSGSRADMGRAMDVPPAWRLSQHRQKGRLL